MCDKAQGIGVQTEFAKKKCLKNSSVTDFLDQYYITTCLNLDVNNFKVLNTSTYHFCRLFCFGFRQSLYLFYSILSNCSNN